MSDMPEPTRIKVSFGVDVDIKLLNEIKARLENLRPGSVDYCVEWDRLKAHYTLFQSRLDGECSAYMNIAKEQARQLFGLSG